ncbi:MAG TPA: type II toxin-antitoxin system RelE/ParE family toxin [Pirellulaceae bacterium]|jgi:phage-related protein|nr:type II toxin-antitoxin system RelE/ParE family toxin [Pirellulaceae bacterium]
MSKKKVARPASGTDEAVEPIPVAFLATEIKTPPFSQDARLRAGWLLWQLQQGVVIPMPHNRPMPSLAPRCGELRMPDGDVTWRIVYRRDSDALLIADAFAKKTSKTPQEHKERVLKRLARYDEVKRAASETKK